MVYSFSLELILLFLCGNFWIVNCVKIRKSTCENHPVVLFVIKWRKELKDLAANQLAISINNDHDLLGFTKVVCCVLDVLIIEFSSIISDHWHTIAGDTEFPNIFASGIECFITRKIIDKNNVIIFILLS